jgi:hypothetical protein
MVIDQRGVCMTPETAKPSQLDRQDKFILAEYAAVREEVKWIIAQTHAIETRALLSSGAVWAWILAPTRIAPAYYHAVIWLPFALSMLFLVKRASPKRSLKECAEFSLNLERHFTLGPALGWEQYLREPKTVADCSDTQPSGTSRKTGAHHFRAWKFVFWAALIGLNFTFALLIVYQK